jgi:thiamine kinase-like enzyme
MVRNKIKGGNMNQEATELTPQQMLEQAVGGIMRHIEEEKATGYVATDATDVPVAVGDITPDWLTKILCAKHPGAAITSLTEKDHSHGTTARGLLTMEYNEAGQAAGLPKSLFGKATPSLQERIITGLSGAARNECGFYNNVRPNLDLELPICYFANADPESHRSILLFTDHSSDGTVFTNPSVYIDREKAEGQVRLLAGLHAATRESPLLKEIPGINTALGFQELLNMMINFEQDTYDGMEIAESVSPQSLMSSRETMYAKYMKSLELNVAMPSGLAHNDVHIGNWYVTPDGRMGLTDFQCGVLGHGSGDVAYALSSGLTVEDRRAWEQDLIKIYLEELHSKGVDRDVGFDDYWLWYRQQMFHGFAFWTYTIGAKDTNDEMQPQAYCLTNIERMAAALDDLESLKSIDL